jgi:hypothetical protein
MESSNFDVTANIKADTFRVLMAAVDTPLGPASAAVAGDGGEAWLRETTTTWIDALPNSVRPRELGARYPWIADKLCLLWNEPRRCTRYLADLLIARSGTRDGFGPKVAREISGLRLHYAMLHPRERGWTDAH